MGNEELTLLVTVGKAFSTRMPSQRVLDAIGSCEVAPIGELLQNQPFRIIAFRKLVELYPEHDTRELWAHAYDVEVEVEDVDPTSNGYMTPAQSSAISGA